MRFLTLSIRKYAIVFSILFLSNILFSQTTIASHNFDAGNLEGWTSNGNDSGLFNNSAWTCSGSYSIYSKDNEYDRNEMTSPGYDLTPYSAVTVSFCGKRYGTDYGESFDLKFYDGSTWVTVMTFVRGTHFTGNWGGSYNLEYTIDSATHTFASNSRIRFSSNANDNDEYFFFDNIELVAPTYCESEGNTAFNTGITNVTFNTINNSDGSPKDNGYEDFTGISTTVAQGTTHNLSVSVDTDGGYNLHTKAWIDWNQDLDFDDFGEEYDFGDTNVDGPMTALPITIPVTSTLGSTRMRVATRYNINPESCDTGYDGEVEDYTINIINGTPTPEINVQGNAVNIVDGDTTPSVTDDTDFGNVNTTGGTNPNTFTIQNTGTATLAVGAITIGGANASDFTVTTLPATTVASSSNTTFVITFNPSADGQRNANVTIVNGDSDENPYNFNIQGTGFTPLPEINIRGNGNTITDGDTTPAAIDDTDFGLINIFAETNVNTFTIQNTGTSSLTVGTITISGAHAGDFTITSSPAATVAASGNTSFDITFDPSGAGIRTAAVSIVNNDSNENPYNFNIQGTGDSGCSSTVGTFPYNESFESGLGTWTQATYDDQNWTRQNGGTPSFGTGPSGANGGSWYVFTEASDPIFNDSFVLESPCFDLTSETYALFSFYYHMYGAGMGDLFLEISTNGGYSYPTVLWSQTAGEVQTSSGQAWELENVNLSSYVGQSVKLRFRGETAGDYRGDMAIDDISITNIEVVGPEINVLGNSTTIVDGDATPSVIDDTDFGTVSTLFGSESHTFTIQNTGTSNLNLTGTSPYVVISGIHAGDFTVTSTPNSSITSGNSTSFEITFAPSAAGLRTATVSIANDDVNEDPYNFNIQGNGYTPFPEINIQGNLTTIVDGDTTPSATDDTNFGSVNTVSGTNVNTFTIQNSGSSNLTVGTINITGANAADFAVTSTPAGTVGSSSSTTFDITFDPSGVGLRNASVSIVNNDSNENPYNFNIQGTGITGPPSYTAYYEDFDRTNGGWSNTTTTNDSWVWTNNFPTNELGEGSFWRNNNFDNYNNNTNIIIQSPVINLSGLYNLQLTLDVKCKTENDRDGMIIQYSVAGGTWTTLGATGDGTNWYESYASALGDDAWNGDTHTQSPSFNPHNQFNNTRIDLNDALFSNQSNVRFRLQFRTNGSGVNDGVAFDNFRIEADPISPLGSASVAPANQSSNLRLWLKMNEGVTAIDGNPLTEWEDQAYTSDLDKEDASAASSMAPTYRDNATRNINFNPVADFDNSNVEYMNGKGGFFSQDYFVVFHCDDVIDTNTGNYSPGRQFAIGGRFSDIAFHEDPTGLGLGSVSSRYDNEVLSHNIDSYPLSGPPDADSYGRSFTSSSASYRNHPTIVNVKTNTSGTLSEIYKNGKRVDNRTGVAGDGTSLNFSEFNNLSFLVGTGRSGIAGRTSSQMNGMIAEVISYSSPNSAINQQKIQSYLALKYGVTLQSSGTSYDHSNHRQNDVDYLDSKGDVIWDASSSTSYNYDIAGIGRDDASVLNQKQSKSQNLETDGMGPTSGFLTIGLNDIYDTNSQHLSNEPATFNDREFLVWGNNGADLNLAATVITVNMSEDITPALTTDVSFTAMQRVWKVVESGGDVSSAKVRLPQSAIRNIIPPGNFYMFISSTGVFDPTADYRIMTSDGNGNLETDYDFDGTKYITFGYAPRIEVVRSLYFNGSNDYVDMEDALNLNPSGFTISAWIKRDAADSGTKSIVSKRNTSFSTGYDFRILNNNRINISWKNPNNRTLSSSTAIPDNEWHHVSAIYNGTTVKLYIDGVEDASANRSAPVQTDDSFFIAAAGKNAPTQHFRGNIDEVRVWDTALTPTQLRFIMNQEIEDNSNFVAGKILPTTITKNDVATVPWTKLAGYYPMSIYTYTNTEDASGNGNQGALRNLKTVDRQTAPLPYISRGGGDWSTHSTWLNGDIQPIPNQPSIVNSSIPIDWNIVRIGHNVKIATEDIVGRERQVLGLYVDAGELTVDGDNEVATAGNGLTVSHYLKLDGKIDLEGQSQLIQGMGSELDPTSSGSLEKDQQGTADVYTYNYWSSPVGQTNTTTINNSFSVSDVMYDGTNPINFSNSGYDGSDGATITIADYWIWKFANQADGDYSAWQHVRQNGNILAGEGFTMKGPGSGAISDDQNYVFLGKPNNGNINLTLNAGNDYLVGNPYPSAIDANQFITDNGPTISGAGANPLISGTLYYWEHWGGGNHNLQSYQGGYATYNFSGGVAAPSLGTNDPNVGTGGTPTKIPGRYIPVSQGFFVVGETTGNINFNNGQRDYKIEKSTGADNSVFVRSSESSANASDNNEIIDDRMKFRIGFNSINTIHRQLLLTIDDATTMDYDWAYDAKIYDDQMDDLYWLINDEKFTIQGSNEVEPETVYPLGIKTINDGLNTITIDALENVPDTIEIYIHDIENDTYHDLRASDFEFVLTAGEYLDRFELTFRNAHADTLSIDETKLNTIDVFYNLESQSIALYNPNFIDVRSITLFNIIGQEVAKIEDISELDYSEYQVKNLSTGTYILKIDTLSGLLSKKVLVK
ncbi:choice-of-anchor D domain-containing protein [Psychroserpens damuponensis]|uniref:choice-of-anchor D domain-containing protein n=1 Tax=Psychroserpens damuponensis TaxID=943936 RepID=UPI00069454D3|nr:choice-of-anchor D domain-containing protein [Psychroserpens damuponensis]